MEARDFPPHVAKAVRRHRRQEDMAREVGISRRTLQRIEDGEADLGRLKLYANAYIGAAVRAGELTHVAYLVEVLGEDSTRGLVPRWAYYPVRAGTW